MEIRPNRETAKRAIKVKQAREKFYAPSLKKFCVIWVGPQQATAEDRLYVANIIDEPATWTPFEWQEHGRGNLVCGEIHTIRRTGSTGTYMCGLWRTGVGVSFPVKWTIQK